MMMPEVTNEDCMDLMSRYPDKYFDLAVVDPGYGIGQDWSKSKKSVHYSHRSTYTNESIPDETYFKELFRVSKNQIIWGGNYFTEYLTPSNNWIVWDKIRDVEKTFMSEVEFAWTSFPIPSRLIQLRWDGAKKCEDVKKNHPHQKPVKLYSWIYHKYLPNGGKVLDTHLGSGSNRISADKAGNIDFWACELDKEYFDDQEKRFRDYASQLTLF